MRSRTLLNVSLGILALALAYHFGAQTASAQLPGGQQIVGITLTGSGSSLAAVTSNGDVYTNTCAACDTWAYRANVFGSGPTSTTTQESFGSLKARYRGPVEPQGVKRSTNR